MGDNASRARGGRLPAGQRWWSRWFTNGPDGEDESYPSRGFAWRDGILYYASYPGILEFIPAFQI